MAMYESDHTRFMREWMEKHPQELEVQKSGRALWWDKPAADEGANKRLAEADTPRKAYYYDAN
jgi:hypothetical protein